MRTIEICLTPNLSELFSVRGKAVVVTDVLRASSSIVAGLAKGIPKIAPVSSVAEVAHFTEQGYRSAGERDGKKIDGFDLGNSPLAFMAAASEKLPIVMTTTNGTRAIAKAQNAREILIGCFLNLAAVSSYLSGFDGDILILCAGWRGNFNLEDTLFAGALAQEIMQKNTDISAKNDAVYAAKLLFETTKNNLEKAIEQSEHRRRLKGEQAKKDVTFCLQTNTFSNVPHYQAAHLVNRTT